jgi:hypothetical protein
MKSEAKLLKFSNPKPKKPATVKAAPGPRLPKRGK